MYATKEKDNSIQLWRNMPKRDSKLGWRGILIGYLENNNLLHGLTFENSPMEVELKIKEK